MSLSKQQLASLIWKYCEELRTSSITTVEYKDFILGFIFYKFLSDNLEQYLISIDYSKEDIKKELNEKSKWLVDHLKEQKGYFIEYKNLFSTWVENIDQISFAEIFDAFNAFDRNVGNLYKTVYDGIFDTLITKLDELGQTEKEKILHTRGVIRLINPIPTNNINQNYDVLGYIYEFLLGKFNSLAEKGGEFYTPHEISIIMSDIASHHLKNNTNIKVYDPTSGSGSLLINIGESIKKHLNNVNVEYYAQELAKSTYNLTRMNLIMKGIKPQNIEVRNGDTLGQDWPFLEKAVQVDCVIANPPYSQNWKPDEHELDPRFDEYGLAPAKKRADYAFLLHCLYHMNYNGIMQIVLPHGVLFRGGSEQKIRTNLVEKNNIETIIGLPPNIFSNTPIPTCILILKKDRQPEDSSILFIDASKEFIKEGKLNVLQGSNIRKITDVVLARKDIPHFAKVVSKEEIANNDYNLNISKYISSNIPKMPYDLYSTVCGGIPNVEIQEFNIYWNEFKSLKDQLFKKENEHSSSLITNNVDEVIDSNEDVSKYRDNFKTKFVPLHQFLVKILIKEEITNPFKTKEDIIQKIFKISESINIIDKYHIYNAFDAEWITILNDIESINQYGKKILREIEEKSEIKEAKDKKKKVWYDGKIFSCEIIKNNLYKEKVEIIKKIESEISNLDNNIFSILEEIEEDYKIDFYNEENDSIKAKEFKNVVKEIDKKHIEKDSNEEKIIKIDKLIANKKNLNKELKKLKDELNKESLDRIEKLTDTEINDLLEAKWITPIINNIYNLVDNLLNSFASNINELIRKYKHPIEELDNTIKKEEKELVSLLNELKADDYDKKALEDIIKLLGGQ